MATFAYTVSITEQAQNAGFSFTKNTTYNTQNNVFVKNPSLLNNARNRNTNRFVIECVDGKFNENDFSARFQASTYSGAPNRQTFSKENGNVTFTQKDTGNSEATFDVVLTVSQDIVNARLTVDGTAQASLPKDMFCAFENSAKHIGFPASATFQAGKEQVLVATVDDGYQVKETPRIKITDGATVLVDADMNSADQKVFSLPVTIAEYHATISGTLTGKATLIPVALPITWETGSLYGFEILDKESVIIKEYADSAIKLKQLDGKDYISEYPYATVQVENPNALVQDYRYHTVGKGTFKNIGNGEWVFEWNNGSFENIWIAAPENEFTKAIVTLTGNATELTQNIVNNPFVSLFYMSMETLNKLLDVRFYKYDGATGETDVNASKDLSDFVLDVYKPYVPIEVTDTAPIKLGFYDTKQNAPLVKPVYSYAETGKFLVKGKAGNSTDYDSRISLFLPFKGFVDIPPYEIIGKEISVKYTIENITGNACIEVLANGNIIEAFTGSVKYGSPIRSNDVDSVRIQNAVENSNLYFSLECYLNLYWKDVLNEQAIPPITDCDIMLAIRDISGYCEGDLFNFHGISAAIRKEEKEMVVRLIQDGIIVKNETAKNP